MKFPLTAFTTVLCISLPTARAVRTDCLDEKRYNLETVCRTTCEKENAGAFSVYYDDTNDTCRCHGKIDGLGVYTGSAQYGETDVTCYSIAEDGKTKVVGYGDCIDEQGTVVLAKFCDDVEDQEDCLEKEGYNRETVCRNECSKGNSAAFAVSYAEDIDDGSVLCQCYSDQATWTARGVSDPDDGFTCYSMTGDNIELIGYGVCTVEVVVTDHVMKKCDQDPNLRGSTSLQ